MATQETPPVTVTTEAKPGYKTTEFWLMVLALVVSTVQEAVGLFNITDNRVLLFQSIIVGAYTLSRGVAKAAVPAIVKPTDIQGIAPVALLAFVGPPMAIGLVTLLVVILLVLLILGAFGYSRRGV